MTEQDTRSAPAGKTAKQIADELGIDKSTVFRYCRSALLQPISTTPGRNGAKYYDATAEKAIKDHFEQSRARFAAGRTIARNSAESSTHQCIAPPADAAPVRNSALQQLEKIAVERDHLRQQLDDAAADRETLIKQVNQMRGEITGRAAEVKRLVDQLDQLRQDHRQELDRIQAGHAAELDRLRTDHWQQLDDLRAQLDEVKHDLTEERQHSRDTAERLAQLADQAQRLQLAQMQPPAALPEEITPQDKPPTLWQRLFGKKE